MRCQIRRNADCASGDHTFIVSRWLMGTQQQVATGFVCQKCLLLIEGKNELDKAIGEINERHEQENRELTQKSTRNKTDKSTGGQT